MYYIQYVIVSTVYAVISPNAQLDNLNCKRSQLHKINLMKGFEPGGLGWAINWIMMDREIRAGSGRVHFNGGRSTVCGSGLKAWATKAGFFLN